MPRIPNLELGYQYFFGNKIRSGQVNADYLLPYNIGNDTVLFGEAHANYWDFGWKPSRGASNRVDLSFGGGARKVYSNELLLGINGFYDTSRLFNNWYSSGGLGLEMVANIGASDAVDLNANWYGDLFSSNSILNAFRNRGGSCDIQAGYSHALFNQAMDLRLKLTGYKFDTGESVYGYMTGADLTTRDGMFTLRYEYGNDRVNGSWNNIGAFVNVGFQAENIIRGESPVTMPEPIFKSPRNLRRMLTQKVKRNWGQPAAVVTAAAAVVGPGCNVLFTTQAVPGVIIAGFTKTSVLNPEVPASISGQATEVLVTFDNPSPNWTGGLPSMNLRGTDFGKHGTTIIIPSNSYSIRITDSNFWTFPGSDPLHQLRIQNGTGAGNWDPGTVTISFIRCN